MMSANDAAVARDRDLNAERQAEKARVLEVTKTGPRYWLPTVPYTHVDLINRSAAATGSVKYAQLAANADYNGHPVRVYYNDYRGYWLAEYQWGERCVLSRGGCADALRAALHEYKRGALGSSVHTPGLSPEDEAVAVSLGYQPWSPEAEAAHQATWWSPLHAKVGEALSMAKWFPQYVGWIANAKTVEEYEAKKAADMHRSRVRAAKKVCSITDGTRTLEYVSFGWHAEVYEGDVVVEQHSDVEKARESYRQKLASGWKAVG